MATKKGLEFPNGVLLFLTYVGHCREANLLSVDEDLQVDYDDYYAHYQRFGRGEKQLASRKKFPNPPPEANLAVGFSFQPPPETLQRKKQRSGTHEPGTTGFQSPSGG